MKRKNNNLSKWFLFSLSIVLLIQLLGIRLTDQPVTFDSNEYLAIAESLIDGKGYAINKPSLNGFQSFKGESPTRMRQPVYPFYLVLFYWLFGKQILLVQFSQIFLNLMTFSIIFLIADHIFKRNLRPGTLIILAVYFPLWLTSAFVLTETLFTFLFTLGMFILLKAINEHHNIILFALCGALFGFAFLTRSIALPVCFLSLLPIWVHLGLRKALSRWSIILIGFLVIISPWFLRNAIVLGDYTPLPSTGGYNLWYGSLPDNMPKWNNPEFKEAVKNGYYMDRNADKRFTKMALDRIKSNPLNYLNKQFINLIRAWIYFPGTQLFKQNINAYRLFRLIQLAILGFAFAGLFYIERSKVVYLFTPILSFSLILIITPQISRYLLPIMPFVLMLSGQGFWHLISSLRDILHQRLYSTNYNFRR